MWVNVDAGKLTGTIQSMPKSSESDQVFNLASIIEFYSR